MMSAYLMPVSVLVLTAFVVELCSCQIVLYGSCDKQKVIAKKDFQLKQVRVLFVIIGTVSQKSERLQPGQPANALSVNRNHLRIPLL